MEEFDTDRAYPLCIILQDAGTHLQILWH